MECKRKHINSVNRSRIQKRAIKINTKARTRRKLKVVRKNVNYTVVVSNPPGAPSTDRELS